MDTGKGFTLLELLLCLSIASIVFGFALPACRHILREAESNQVAGQLMELVYYSRQEAVFKGRIVTLCGSSTGTRCDNHWAEHILVFMDEDGDGYYAAREPLLRHAQLGVEGSIAWRSFRNKTYLQLHPDGLTYYQNGNFTYCPGDGELRYARHLILNVAGYLRLASDRSGDHIPEKANGENIRC